MCPDQTSTKKVKELNNWVFFVLKVTERMFTLISMLRRDIVCILGTRFRNSPGESLGIVAPGVKEGNFISRLPFLTRCAHVAVLPIAGLAVWIEPSTRSTL